ncbi:hypothetical protein [uncultured Methanobrevibacter sp.]|uniref:hypothetical protein n=1 Tax=uncultured Methanobrevibacter sp. TaxID=253161 RepID=UPI0025E6268C|nr:hypothetical protein [uncultured Methanobrevibacter sp.]
MDDKGQITMEFLFLLSLMIIIIICTVNYVFQENEINMALNAAESGALEGAVVDSVSVYTINEYSQINSNKQLTHPKTVKIINISYVFIGNDSSLNKPTIRIQVTASSNEKLSEIEKAKMSQKINTRVRRSIVYAFHNEDSTDVGNYYQCYSDNYAYLTNDVIWV